MDISEGVGLFKEAFRRHAAGVAVITARTPDGVPVGFTATSLASLAIDPPLATFNMARTSSSWAAIETTDYVAIHMLGVENRALAARMSGEHSFRFDGEHWHVGPHDLPILNDVTAWLLGRIVNRLSEAHSAVIVVQIEGGSIEADTEPLLYHHRNYRQPGDLI